MTPERWVQIKEVFTNAAERVGEARAAYVEEACGADEELRREVESLLRERPDGPTFESPIRKPDLSGRSISHYRVLEKLGEGGMGVVYKAEDTQLRRTVALKFLSSETIGNDEVKVRLIREAQASASLDHPNICAVHGIHEENGRTFIAMAFIDGPSLAEKIKERPLPLQEALDIALQIAAGLQEAHEKGVVHRDIKPQNIMLTAKGQVKIMDFGLASLVGRSKLTKSGTRLGTPAYMAPEQLQAKQVDQRADIWALGCVLYEMLAQHSPFEAEYEQAIGYGILNEDPEPVSAQRADVKPEVDRLIAKTLAKDPDERYQDADDLLADLRGLSRREKTAAGVPTPLGPTSKVRLGRILAAVLVVALLLILAFRQLTPPRLETGVIRLSLVLPEGTNLTSRNVAGPTPQIALSPDGHVLAYVASMAGGPPLLWIRALDSMDERELSGTEGASFPFWSPDSQFLGFFAAGKLKMVDAFGGTPKVIADAPHGRGGAWNNVGIIVYADGISTRLKRVRAQGGVPSDATSLDENNGEISHRFPRFLPDGRHFMYVSLANDPQYGGVYVTSLDSEVKKQLLSRGWSTPYVVRDYLLSAYQGKLMAQQFDSRQLKVSGSPAVVAEHVGAGSPSGLAALSVSEAGTLAYSSGTSPNRHLIWFDSLGNRLSQIGDVGEYADPSLSPDERTLAFARVNPDTRTPDIWLFDILRRTETRLTIDPGSDIRPQWSRDGSRLVFTSNRTGNWEIHEKVVTNAEPEKRLTDSAQDKFLTQWSPDSRSLIYSTTSAGTSWDSWFLRVGDGEDIRRSLLQGPFNEVQGVVSQDGLWMAYTSDETGRLEVYVQSFPSGGSKSLISANGGWDPKWSAKGTELFFLSLDGKLMTVSVNTLSDFTPASPKELFEVSVPLPESPFSSNYAVTSDGKRFLINTVIPEATSSPITIVLNGLRKFAER